MNCVKIRLEACSFSIERSETGVVQLANRPRFLHSPTVVGRALTKFDDDQWDLLDKIDTGDKICCQLPASIRFSGTVPGEMEISPYSAYKIPADVDSMELAAIFNPCIRIYTSLHTLARIRRSESVLIACPNDLNLTCLAIQICQLLNLKASALVLDDHAFNITRQIMDPKNLIKIDGVDYKSIIQSCGFVSNQLGFDCILDFKNESNASSHGRLRFQAHIRDFMAVFGRIVTDRVESITSNDAEALLRKSGTVHYVLDEIWHLSPLHYGKYRHMLDEIVSNFNAGKLRPIIGLELNPSRMDELSTKHDEKIGCTVIKW